MAASVEAPTGDGVRYALRYELDVIRAADRWEIAAIAATRPPDPAQGEGPMRRSRRDPHHRLVATALAPRFPLDWPLGARAGRGAGAGRARSRRGRSGRGDVARAGGGEGGRHRSHRRDQSLGVALAVGAVILLFKRDFKEAAAVFAVGLLAVVLATPAGLTALNDLVTALFGSQ